METRVSQSELLMGAMYAPFCRTLYADPSEWDGDLKRMAEMGFNCIHGFTEWWRIEKEDGRFDFSETDALADCCQRHGIRLILNVATQNGVGFYMPRWMQRKYTGRGMVDRDGNSSAVPGEYVTACMDDPWYQYYAQRYLRAVATHYAGDSRVAGWVIWGEPSLTSRSGKPICYCEHTVARFRQYLRRKYGTIQQLNQSWGKEGPSDWKDFDEVLPPRDSHEQMGSYVSWGDFSHFMDTNFASHIKNANDLFKSCGAMQPTITEIFCYVTWGNICNDLWHLAGTSDIVGISNYARPGFETDLIMTVADSIAKKHGKSTFVVEALGGPRYPYYDKRTPTDAEIRAEGVQTVGCGTRGVLYWCYRPRLSDYEGGTFGLCRADGVPLSRAHAVGKLTELLNADWDSIGNAHRRGDVAILFSTQAVHTSRGDATEKTLGQAVHGAIRMCLDSRVTPQLIDEEGILRGGLEEFRVLVLPFSYAMDEDVTEAIRTFVESGGTVIADHNLAMKRLDGICYRKLPGGALMDVMGVQREDLIYLDHASRVPANAYDLTVGDCMDVLSLNQAEAVYQSGNYPLIAHNAFGNGHAYTLAWPMFAKYCIQANRKNREMFKTLLETGGIKPFVVFENWDDEDQCPLSAAVLWGPGGRRIYTIVNPSYEEKEVRAFLSDAVCAHGLIESLVQTEAAPNGVYIRAHLEAWGSIMIQGEVSVENA